jgi:hypothetical protein
LPKIECVGVGGIPERGVGGSDSGGGAVGDTRGRRSVDGGAERRAVAARGDRVMMEAASGDAQRRAGVGMADIGQATDNEMWGPRAALSQAEGAPGPSGRRGAGPMMGTGTTAVAVAVRRRRGVGSRGGGGLKKSKCGRGTVRRMGREGVGVGTKSSQTSVMARYIHQLTDKYTATYICQLTDECTRLSLLV